MLSCFLSLVCKMFKPPEQSCPGIGDMVQLSHQCALAVFGEGGYHTVVCAAHGIFLGFYF